MTARCKPKIGCQVPALSHYHTFHLPAQCQAIESFHDIKSALLLSQACERFYLLGEGSNTIFIEDFDGTVLRNRITGIAASETHQGIQLRVGAGENWHQFVTYALEHGYHGMENLALIPGSVGASPIQNIGAYGVEVAQFIESVEYIELRTGTSKILLAQDCHFGYRDSIFKHELAGKVLITHVNFYIPTAYTPVTSYGELAALVNPTAHHIYEAVIRVRQQKLPDPQVLGNAGSFFKNPVVSQTTFDAIAARYPQVPGYPNDDSGVKIPAAWLIDQLGFKGKQMGGVRCHPTQPLVLTNTGVATGQEVITLAKRIIDAVSQEFGVVLEPEVRLVGREGLISL